MREPRLHHWLLAGAVALGLHAGAAALFADPPADGAEAPGIGGIQVAVNLSAAMAGAEDASSEKEALTKAVVEKAAPAPKPPEPPEPEPQPEQAEAPTQPPSQPEPQVLPDPPAPDPEPVAEPLPQPEPLPRLEPIPEPIPEPEPQVTEPAPPPEPKAVEVVEAKPLPVPPKRPEQRPVRPQVQVKPKPPVEKVEPRAAPNPRPNPAEARKPPPVENVRKADRQQEASRAAIVSQGRRAEARTGQSADERDATGGGPVGRPNPNYINQLRYWLERNKRYPKKARRHRMQGVVYLYFRVTRDGKVLRHEIRKSAGHDLLDGEAEAMLRRAQPLPGFPADMKGGYLDVVVPVQFSLRGNS